MGTATGVGTARRGSGLPWGDILLSAIAAVSWALIGMAGTAALGLHLLRADTAGSLGPMTAAVVALGAGGSVSPSGDVSAFGLKGAQAHTAIEITPLGVSLVGALLLSWLFLRSLRTAGVVVSPAELLARAGSVVALFVAMLGGLAWAGHDVITIDGGSLGLGELPGAGGGGGGVRIPGVGDLGDIGGLLPDRLGDLIHAKAAVGFTVDTAPTLLGGLGWSAGTLLIALLASRRTPLPGGWEMVHRVVRPAASSLVTVLLLAVAAGLAAAAYAAVGDDRPGRIVGAALLGAPNGVWLGVPTGLFVPWDGKATGVLAGLLPDPLDRFLGGGSGRPVTLGRLAELDGRVWLLGVAAALLMLSAGVLTAVRTPPGGGRGAVGSAGDGRGAAGAPSAGQGAVGFAGDGRGAAGAPSAGQGAVGFAGDGRGAAGAPSAGQGAVRFAGRCALRLGLATALTLPLLVWLADVSVDASLSVLGFDAFGAGIDLHGHLGTALLLGAAWGAGAGAAGALLAWAFGGAGRGAAALALGDVGRARGYGDPEHAGPYAPSTPYRPPNPATNPYLRLPEELRDREAGSPAPGDAPPAVGSGPYDATWPRDGGRTAGPAPEAPPAPGDVYGAPTVARPIGPPPRSPRRPAPRSRDRSASPRDDGPPPPPPPPPPGNQEGRR
ncbi:streptophobe family protein [Streptomyces sp. NPDC001544]|uniref:streptophobe family protein n=1 Tax=Streptomyces sp. NPDC001544 TaxID=3364584 RepID=UPI0036B5B311